MKNIRNIVTGYAGLLLAAGCTTVKTPDHLVYYSKLDSATDITAPTVGQAGIVDGAKFVQGKNGNALYAPAGWKNTVSVPFPNGLSRKGCIEFDAKIENPQPNFGTGADPYLFAFGRKSTNKGDLVPVMNMCFNSNNGGGGSGLLFLGIFNYQIITSPNSCGCNRYEYILPKDPKGWHHYKVVWNLDGLKGMKGDIAAAYIDGKLHKSGTLPQKRIDWYAKTYLCDSLTLGFTTDGFGQAGSKSAHLVDEFKVWDTDAPEEFE